MTADNTDSRSTNGTFQLGYEAQETEYRRAEAACRQAFEVEDGYGDPDGNPQRYRVFRDGFFAAWNLRKSA